MNQEDESPSDSCDDVFDGPSTAGESSKSFESLDSWDRFSWKNDDDFPLPLPKRVLTRNRSVQTDPSTAGFPPTWLWEVKHQVDSLHEEMTNAFNAFMHYRIPNLNEIKALEAYERETGPIDLEVFRQPSRRKWLYDKDPVWSWRSIDSLYPKEFKVVSNLISRTDELKRNMESMLGKVVKLKLLVPIPDTEEELPKNNSLATGSILTPTTETEPKYAMVKLLKVGNDGHLSLPIVSDVKMSCQISKSPKYLKYSLGEESGSGWNNNENKESIEFETSDEKNPFWKRDEDYSIQNDDSINGNRLREPSDSASGNDFNDNVLERETDNHDEENGTNQSSDSYLLNYISLNGNTQDSQDPINNTFRLQEDHLKNNEDVRNSGQSLDKYDTVSEDDFKIFDPFSDMEETKDATAEFSDCKNDLIRDEMDDALIPDMQNAHPRQSDYDYNPRRNLTITEFQTEKDEDETPQWETASSDVKNLNIYIKKKTPTERLNSRNVFSRKGPKFGNGHYSTEKDKFSLNDYLSSLKRTALRIPGKDKAGSSKFDFWDYYSKITDFKKKHPENQNGTTSSKDEQAESTSASDEYIHDVSRDIISPVFPDFLAKSYNSGYSETSTLASIATSSGVVKTMEEINAPSVYDDSLHSIPEEKELKRNETDFDSLSVQLQSTPTNFDSNSDSNILGTNSRTENPPGWQANDAANGTYTEVNTPELFDIDVIAERNHGDDWIE